MNAQDLSRLLHFLGFNGPEVKAAYAEYAAEPGYHKLKNIFVEWNKADSQRGAKFFGLIFSFLLLIILTQAVLLSI